MKPYNNGPSNSHDWVSILERVSEVIWKLVGESVAEEGFVWSDACFSTLISCLELKKYFGINP